MNRSTIYMCVALLLGGCSGDSAQSGSASAGGAGEDPSPDEVQGEEYEREIVFTSTPGDSTFISPWLFRSRTGPEGVRREARALLSRGGAWESFFDERWEGPVTRTPWRLLPRPPLRIIVAEDDALDRLIFQEGTRELELLFGETLAEWAGPRGEVFRLQEGAVLLASQQLDGVLLDIARARRADDAPPGDWVFLVGRDVQLFLDDPGGGEEDNGRYRAWTRAGTREAQWPVVDFEWTETRAFDRARRDVPYGWEFSSRDQELRGELTVRTAHLAAGEGAGPLLPVDGLYEVSGSVYLSGTNHEVRGLFRHVQR